MTPASAGGSPCRAWLTNADLAAIPAQEIESPAERTPDPRVSVLMITRNHADYISQAMRSVLDQRATFSYELLIGDDCSDDGTLEVCRNVNAGSGSRARVVHSDSRVGMHRNFARLWHRARGEYIAILEGDDYWTDSDKLAKQVACLDADPEANLCGTFTARVRLQANGGEVPDGRIGPPRIQDRYGIEDLIPDYSFHTSSVMIRRDAVRFPAWLWEVYCVDRPLYLLAVERGHARFIPEVTSVYRAHGSGVWSSATSLEKARQGIDLFARLNQHFGYRFEKTIRRTLRGILWSYIGEEMRAGRPAAAREVLRAARPYWFSGRSFEEHRNTVATWLHLHLPVRARKGG